MKPIAGAWSSIPPDGHEIGFQLNEQAICEYSWTAGAFGDDLGLSQIAAVDLFGRGSSSIFYDDMVLESIKPPCPSDINGDGNVNVTDLLAVLAAWGPNPGHAADFNNDGFVNVTDLLELLAAWDGCP